MQLRMLLALIMLCEARWSHMQLQKQLDQLLGSEEMDWRTTNTAFCSKCAFESVPMLRTMHNVEASTFGIFGGSKPCHMLNRSHIMQ